MGFYNGKEYIRATQENTSAITKDSIKQISIDMPPGPDGKFQTRYFRQIAATDGSDNKSGLNASAWEEIDKNGKPAWVDKNGNPVAQGQGKREIRFSTTGVLEPTDDTGALNEGVQGKLNPQTADMAAFTGKALRIADAQMGKGNYEAVFHSHSYGGVVATAARVVTDLHGVPSPTRTIKFDGGLIGDAQMDLLKAAMHNPKSNFYKAVQATLGAEASAERMHIASENLDRNNLLLVPIGKDEKGRWHTSAVANAVPGEGWATGISTMAKDAIINKDRGIEGSNNPHGDVVFVKVESPKGYKTTAEGGVVSSLHQEVPTLYSVTNPDNLVVAVHTPNGKPPVTFESFMEDFARASAAASPVTMAIKKLGGNDKAFIESAAEGQKGNYLLNAKKAGEAILSIFMQSGVPQGHTSPAENSTTQSMSAKPRLR